MEKTSKLNRLARIFSSSVISLEPEVTETIVLRTEQKISKSDSDCANKSTAEDRRE